MGHIQASLSISPANTTLFPQSFHAALTPPLPAACAFTPQYDAIITTVSVLCFSHLHIRSRLTLSTPSPLSSPSRLPSSSAYSAPYSAQFCCSCSFFLASRLFYFIPPPPSSLLLTLASFSSSLWQLLLQPPRETSPLKSYAYAHHRNFRAKYLRFFMLLSRYLHMLGVFADPTLCLSWISATSGQTAFVRTLLLYLRPAFLIMT